MPLKFTYVDRTVAIIPHEGGQYIYPLHYPANSGHDCPVQHKNWRKGDCIAIGYHTPVNNCILV
jgi:hypothetical protein